MRIYVTGEVMVEHDGRLIREADFPSRQARLAFVELVLNREHPTPHADLADDIWNGAPPPRWEASLSALISKLRTTLGRAGLDRDTVIVSVFGCYQLRLPAGVWVDVDAVRSAIHNAEGARQSGDIMSGYGDALVATIITRRAFLIGESGAWVEAQRARLHDDRVRALECMIACHVVNDETTLAIACATELVELESFRETGYLSLMRLHASTGNRAEALVAYERCRRMLRDQLGVSPSAEMESLYRDLLTPSPPR